MESPCIQPNNSSPVDEQARSKNSEVKDNAEQRKHLDCPTATIDRTLLIYKTFYLLFFAGFGATFPYLTIYFKQLGLNATFVGTLSGIRPLVQFIGGPFWAYIGDKYRCRKLVLCMSVAAWLVMTFALAFPQPRNTNCQHVNTTSIKKRDVHPPLTYPSLSLSPMPAAVSDRPPVDKKSMISFAMTHSARPSTTEVLVYDKRELQHLFYIFLILIIVGEFFEAPSFIMIDTALIQLLGEKCHDYGKTRLFGSVGYGLASFGVGAVLDTTRYVYCGREMNDYMVIFYFFAGFMVTGFVFVIVFFSFKYTEDETTTSSSIFAVYKLCFSLKYASFLLTAWFMGIGNGAQVTFINWYLEDLGASKFMMGLTTTIRCSAVIMGFFFSGAVINRLGEVPSVFWSLLVFAAIFFGYSYLVNPWLVIPLEIMQGSVYAISWSTCIVYLSAVTPDNGAATMQSILQGIYWGLGAGIGAILGGLLINQYGIVLAYRIGGTATIAVTVQFVLTQWLVMKYEASRSMKKDEAKSNDADPLENRDLSEKEGK